MKIGIVDIGSNSTKCIIYEIDNKNIKIAYSQTYYNRMGESVFTTHQIKQNKIMELIEILQKFKSENEKIKADNIVCLGTWTLRIAQNGNIVVKNVKEKTGLEITILDEHAESLYSFHSLNFFKSLTGKKTALNIGGGSIEIATGEKQLESSITLNLGGIILKEKFFHNTYIPNFAKINQATEYIWKVLKEEKIETKIIKNTSLVGIGGTFASLFDILASMKKESEVIEEGLIKIPEQSFSLFFNKVKNMNNEEIQKRFGLHEKRADIFIPSLTFVKSLMDVLQLPVIYISTLSLREGYIYYHYLKETV